MARRQAHELWPAKPEGKLIGRCFTCDGPIIQAVEGRQRITCKHARSCLLFPDIRHTPAPSGIVPDHDP